MEKEAADFDLTQKSGRSLRGGTAYDDPTLAPSTEAGYILVKEAFEGGSSRLGGDSENLSKVSLGACGPWNGVNTKCRLRPAGALLFLQLALQLNSRKFPVLPFCLVRTNLRTFMERFPQEFFACSCIGSFVEDRVGSYAEFHVWP